MHVDDSKPRITISKKGSYKVEGPVALYDGDGNRIETTEGKAFFLCRCGQSANKPFCDGTHNRCEWDPTLAGG
jgi:CDGSH-type Zn-finger protein